MRVTSRSVCSLSGLLFLIVGCAATRAAEAPDHVPGRLLVQYRGGAETAATERALRAHGAIVRRRLPELRMNVLEVPEEQSGAILESLRASGQFEYVERDYYARTGAVTPNDPDYVSQWYLPKISAPAAWSVTTGSAAVVVAVIDSGVDGTHPDLSAKLVPGWNFVGNNANTSDVLGHGTAVAGTVAAATNNGIGVAGVAWNAMIMPLVVVDSTDYASYSNMAAAIQYAADHGAKIINLSIGGSSASAALQSAVDYAWGKGVTIFASAMNNGSTAPEYPAACTNVIAVSATDNNDALATFSDYGNWIGLAAPGTSIVTTDMGGGYGSWYGTSFSAPIAAGVGALALAVNPALTNAALVALLEQNSDDLGASGYDASFGWGRVNAYKAVTAAQASLTPVTVSIAPRSAVLSAGQTQQFQAVVTGASNPAVTWTLSPAVGTLVNGLYTAPALLAASQTVTVTARLASGASAVAAVTLTPPATSANFVPVRINAAGSSYTDATGVIWSRDTAFTGGNTAGTSAAIRGTATPTLYQTCRFGAFSYQFAAPNGNYTVTLKFAEVYFTAPGKRKFNVSINGTTVLSNFDIVAQAGATLTALDLPFPVTVSGGQIAVQFSVGAADQPLVNAIQVVAASTASGGAASQASAAALFRADAGGPAYTDGSGNVWSADFNYIGGSTSGTGAAVRGTSTAPLYQTCRWGNFSYAIGVPNGNYTVNLKFAEIYFTAAGQRQFNVSINGVPVLSNFDIVAQAGATLTAVDRSFPVAVTNGKITIQFTAGAADQPLVSAIEILMAN